ncbi:type II-A CRISPR-associated protein Csn2 [Fusobacterium sp. PH5-44]|uniref:type II-A CRISPR-associated protein Csn2 n=1 Tax=unclassified Fusobacterium TaxID=2648384 RepID=UPI003D200660
MKLIYSNLEKHIVFQENTINEIIIENPNYFYNFIYELKSQINGNPGKFVLSDNNKELNISKEFEIITDFFSIDLNDKKITTKLYNELKSISYSEDIYLKTQTLLSNLEEYLSEIEFLSEYNFSFNSELDIVNVFKAYGINFDINNNKFIDKFFQFISLIHDLLNKKVIVLINMKSFISKEELSALYSMIAYKKIHLLLIESNEKYKLDSEARTIIDKDICEIF